MHQSGWKHCVCFRRPADIESLHSSPCTLLPDISIHSSPQIAPDRQRRLKSISKIRGFETNSRSLPKYTLRLHGTCRRSRLSQLELNRRTRSYGYESDDLVHKCVRNVFGRAKHARRARYRDVSRPSDLIRTRPHKFVRKEFEQPLGWAEGRRAGCPESFRTLVQLAG